MIVDRYHVKHVSTGDILRECQEWNCSRRRGQEVHRRWQAGSDALLIDIIKDRLAKDDVKGGWMLDGFPPDNAPGRSTGQDPSGSRPEDRCRFEHRCSRCGACQAGDRQADVQVRRHLPRHSASPRSKESAMHAAETCTRQTTLRRQSSRG